MSVISATKNNDLRQRLKRLTYISYSLLGKLFHDRGSENVKARLCQAVYGADRRLALLLPAMTLDPKRWLFYHVSPVPDKRLPAVNAEVCGTGRIQMSRCIYWLVVMRWCLCVLQNLNEEKSADVTCKTPSTASLLQYQWVLCNLVWNCWLYTGIWLFLWVNCCPIAILSVSSVYPLHLWIVLKG